MAAEPTDLTPFLITYRVFLSGSAGLGRGPCRSRRIFLSVNMSNESFSDGHPGCCRDSLKPLPGLSQRKEGFSLRVTDSGRSSFCPCTLCSHRGTQKRKLEPLQFW